LSEENVDADLNDNLPDLSGVVESVLVAMFEVGRAILALGWFS